MEMAVVRRRRNLGDLAFYAAIAGAAAVPLLLLLAPIGGLVAPPPPMVFEAALGLVILATIALPLAAVAMGLVFRHREPRSSRALHAIVIGSCILASVAGLMLLVGLTWLSIQA